MFTDVHRLRGRSTRGGSYWVGFVGRPAVGARARRARRAGAHPARRGRAAAERGHRHARRARAPAGGRRDDLGPATRARSRRRSRIKGYAGRRHARCCSRPRPLHRRRRGACSWPALVAALHAAPAWACACARRRSRRRSRACSGSGSGGCSRSGWALASVGRLAGGRARRPVGLRRPQHLRLGARVRLHRRGDRRPRQPVGRAGRRPVLGLAAAATSPATAGQSSSPLGALVILIAVLMVRPQRPVHTSPGEAGVSARRRSTRRSSATCWSRCVAGIGALTLLTEALSRLRQPPARDDGATTSSPSPG